MSSLLRKWTRDFAFWLLDQRKTRGYHLMNDLRFWTRGRPVDLIFDVGANVGQTVLRFKQYFPDARIEAFEPVSETFDSLRSYTGAYRDVRCHPIALGENERTTHIRLAPDSCLKNSLTYEVSAEQYDELVEEISIRTLDAFCEEQGFSNIDILKTDTEGHDLSVLKGGDVLLERKGIDFILSETSFSPFDDEHTTFCPLNDYLQAKGYRVAGIYEIEHKGGTNPEVNYCNVLYVREGLFD